MNNNLDVKTTNKAFLGNRHKLIEFMNTFGNYSYVKVDLLTEFTSISIALMNEDIEFLSGDIYIFDSGTENSNSIERVEYRKQNNKLIHTFPIIELVSHCLIRERVEVFRDNRQAKQAEILAG